MGAETLEGGEMINGPPTVPEEHQPPPIYLILQFPPVFFLVPLVRKSLTFSKDKEKKT